MEGRLTMSSYVYTNFDNETVEVEISEEIQSFLEADDKRVHREERKAKRYERHFKPYSWNNYHLFSVASCEDEYNKFVERVANEEQENDILQKIYEVLDTCTPKQKERFLLYAVEGLTLEKIAEIQDVDFTSVRQSIKQVKRKIKIIFKKA